MSPADESLLRLQQTSGNATVVRMLSRQHALQMAPTLPQRVDMEDPLINTPIAPTVGRHGEYAWYVRYRLRFTPSTHGYIIQERSIIGSDSPLDHVWECWRVEANTREPVEPVEKNGTLSDDQYTHTRVPGHQPPAQGWHRHTGIVRFYPGDAPPEFKTRDAKFDMIDSEPSGWTGAGKRHDCYVEWDRNTYGLVAYAGAEELRAGPNKKLKFRQ